MRGARYRKTWVPGHPRGPIVRDHVLIAETALGKYLPPGAEVHHVDGNRTNNAPINLVICQDAAYHKLLHRNRRVLVAGGNPHTDSICTMCRRVLPKTDFPNRPSRKSVSGDCLVCNRQRRAAQRLKERDLSR